MSSSTDSNFWTPVSVCWLMILGWEYRVVFECKYERSTDLSPGETAEKAPQEKGGDENGEISHQ